MRAAVELSAAKRNRSNGARPLIGYKDASSSAAAPYRRRDGTKRNGGREEKYLERDEGEEYVSAINSYFPFLVRSLDGSHSYVGD